MPTEPPIVSVRSVGVCYRSRSRFLGPAREYWALDDVSFEVYPGETIGLIGRNGSGKTTLLKAIAGIVEPDRGSIERGDINLSMLSLQVGFLPQLSGRENAILSGMLLGLERSAAQAQVKRIEIRRLGRPFRPAAGHLLRRHAARGWASRQRSSPPRRFC